MPASRGESTVSLSSILGIYKHQTLMSFQLIHLVTNQVVQITSDEVPENIATTYRTSYPSHQSLMVNDIVPSQWKVSEKHPLRPVGSLG
jgi:uncharacterized protein (DUF2249 family)